MSSSSSHGPPPSFSIAAREAEDFALALSMQDAEDDERRAQVEEDAELARNLSIGTPVQSDEFTKQAGLMARQREKQQEQDLKLALELSGSNSGGGYGASVSTTHSDSYAGDFELAKRLLEEENAQHASSIEKDYDLALLLQRDSETERSARQGTLYAPRSEESDHDAVLAKTLQDCLQEEDIRELESWDAAMALHLELNGEGESEFDAILSLMEVFPTMNPKEIREAIDAAGSPEAAAVKLVTLKEHFPLLRETAAGSKPSPTSNNIINGSSRASGSSFNASTTSPEGPPRSSPKGSAGDDWRSFDPELLNRRLAMKARFPTIPEATLDAALRRSHGDVQQAEAILQKEHPERYLKGLLLAKPSAGPGGPEKSTSNAAGRNKSSKLTTTEFIESMRNWGSVDKPTERSLVVSGQLYDTFRSEAIRHGDELFALIKERRDLNQAGRTVEAAELNARVAFAEKRRDKAKRDAADATFALTNPRLCQLVIQCAEGEKVDLSSMPTVDLHHLLVDEALQRTFCMIKLAYHWRWPSLKIITGKGNHSAGGSKLLAPVRGALERSTNLTVQSFTSSVEGGSFIVSIKRRRENGREE